MKIEKPSSLIFMERIEKGEVVKCPLCKKGTWHGDYNSEGKNPIFSCDNCKRAIVPRYKSM